MAGMLWLGCCGWDKAGVAGIRLVAGIRRCGWDEAL